MILPFYLVHETATRKGPASGRARFRTDVKLSRRQALLLQKELGSLPGLAKIQVNHLTGSVLVYYEDDRARQSALSLLASDLTEVFSGPLSPEKIQAKTPSIFWHITGYSLRRLFLPMPVATAFTLISSVPFIFKGLLSLKSLKCNVELLDAAAIGAALITGNFSTASMTIFLLQLGEILEEWVKQVSREKLEESIALQISHVWVLKDGVEIEIPFSTLAKDDVIILRAGAVIPVDGQIVGGEATVNQAALTGESLAVYRGEGASVFAGTIVEEGEILVQVSYLGKDTRLEKILHFINDSEKTKASIQSRSERLADMAVPFTFIFSGLIWLFTRNFMRASSVLAVDYACALRLTTPLIMLSGMKDSAKNGILIKGGKYLETLAEADMIVFDKTGTLTNATPSVAEVVAAPSYDRTSVLRLAACLEEHFPHPVARAVVKQAEIENLHHQEEHAKVKYILAHGVVSEWREKRVIIGSRHFVECDEKVDVSALEDFIGQQAQEGRSLLYLAIGGELAGVISIEDPLRDTTLAVVDYFKRQGMEMAMLTGDDERTAGAIARKLGIQRYKAQVLPEDKVAQVKEYQRQGYKIIMVGDGINDSPALSAADAGVSLSDGTDLAQEVANIVLVHPRLENLVSAQYISRQAMARIKTNYIATMSLNTLFMFGGAFGLLTAATSALLHNLTTVGSAFYAVRPIVAKKYREES